MLSPRDRINTHGLFTHRPDSHPARVLAGACVRRRWLLTWWHQLLRCGECVYRGAELAVLPAQLRVLVGCLEEKPVELCLGVRVHRSDVSAQLLDVRRYLGRALPHDRRGN